MSLKRKPPSAERRAMLAVLAPRIEKLIRAAEATHGPWSDRLRGYYRLRMFGYVIIAATHGQRRPFHPHCGWGHKSTRVWPDEIPCRQAVGLFDRSKVDHMVGSGNDHRSELTPWDNNEPVLRLVRDGHYPAEVLRHLCVEHGVEDRRRRHLAWWDRRRALTHEQRVREDYERARKRRRRRGAS